MNTFKPLVLTDCQIYYNVVKTFIYLIPIALELQGNPTIDKKEFVSFHLHHKFQ